MYNPYTPFGPVVEANRFGAFLPEHPLKIMKKNKIADIPTVFSFVACEGLYPAADFAYDETLDVIDRNWDSIMPLVLHYNDAVSIEDMDNVSRRIREEYLKDKQVKMETFDDFVQVSVQFDFALVRLIIINNALFLVFRAFPIDCS